MLHPGDMLAVERFLGGDMDHVGGRPGAVPVLFVRRNPDDVAGVDFEHLFAPGLHPADSGNSGAVLLLSSRLVNIASWRRDGSRDDRKRDTMCNSYAG